MKTAHIFLEISNCRRWNYVSKHILLENEACGTSRDRNHIRRDLFAYVSRDCLAEVCFKCQTVSSVSFIGYFENEEQFHLKSHTVTEQQPVYLMGANKTFGSNIASLYFLNVGYCVFVVSYSIPARCQINSRLSF